MRPADSVTVWIHQLRAGHPEAAQKLWEGYFHRLVGLARAKLRSIPRQAADEEDVALSAFDSFCRGAAGGRFPRLGDRDDLWQVLFTICSRKAAGLTRHEGRAKRGGGAVVQASAVDGAGSVDRDVLAAAAADDPTPAVVAEVTEACGRLLSLLGQGDLRRVATLKMEGYGNAEIAAAIGRSVPTVERKLRDIRRIWGREGQT